MVYDKIETKVQRYFISFLSPHMYSILHYHHPPPEWYIITTNELTLTHHYYSKTIVYIGFTLGAVRSMSSGKCIMTYFRHYSTTQIIFSVLKSFCVLPTDPSPKHWATTDLFTVSIVSALPELSYSWNCTVCSLFTLVVFT